MEVNKIYCGNALDLIDDVSGIDLIITSPPDINETNYNLSEYREFINIMYKKCSNTLSNNGVLVSSSTDTKVDGKVYLKHVDIIKALEDWSLFNYKIWKKKSKADLYILTFSHILIFRKSNKIKITNNRLKEYYPDVWDIEIDKIKGYKSKDSFPSELVRRFILNFSNEGDLILDPFIGTGKVGKVCKDFNRNFIGFEIEQSFVDIANNLIWG